MPDPTPTDADPTAAEGVYRRPMFPLGRVLVPTAVLPLHLFEPRYLALVDDVRAAPEPELGIVLIERGSEVGGGDVRTSVGTMTRLLQADELPGERWAIVVGGVRRIRVVRWLADEPYPSAQVVDWPDADLPDARTDPLATAAVLAGLEPVVARLRTALALAAELGEPVAPSTVEISDEPVSASFQIAALAPIGPADQQRLLEVPGVEERTAILDRLLAEVVEVQQARLALG